MSLKCLDNFMHYSKTPAYASLESFSFMNGYRTLEQTSKDYNGPIIKEGFDMPGYQQAYGTVNTDWRCTSRCSNQWVLCHKPSGDVCHGTGCAPASTGPKPVQTKEGFLSRENYIDIPTRRYRIKLNSNFKRDQGKLLNDSGFFILEDLGRGEYIIQSATEKPNYDILIANTNRIEEIKV